MTSGMLLYYGGLALWSAFIAYALLFAFRKPSSDNHKEPVSAPIQREPVVDRAIPPVYDPSPTTPSVRMSQTTVAPIYERLSVDGFKAFQSGPELTVDDIVEGLARQGKS